MSLKEEIEIDIHQFFRQIENTTHNDKLEILRMLLQKYAHLTSSYYIMDSHDLTSIIGNAKSKFANDSLPIYLGNKKTKVRQGDIANLFLIESTILHLNKNDCLKKIPKFDKHEE